MDQPLSDLLASPSELGENARAQVNPELAAEPMETPVDTQQRVQRTQLVKAKDLAQAGLPTWEQANGIVQPVTDSTGTPLTHYDRSSGIAYDSSGAPQKVGYDSTGAPVLSDPLANAPEVSAKNPDTGLYDKYRVAPGLPWQYEQPDEQRNAVIAATQQRQATNAAATALGRQLSADEGQIVKGSALIKAQKKRLLGDVPLDPALLGEDPKAVEGDPAQVHAAIDAHFNDQYASPAANEKEHFWGGDLSPQAQQLRAQLDTSKAQAHQRAAALFAQQDQVNQLQQTRAQRLAVEEQLRQSQLRDAAQRAGLTIPGLEDGTNATPSGIQDSQQAGTPPTSSSTQPLQQGTAESPPQSVNTGAQPNGSVPSTASSTPSTSVPGTNGSTTTGTSSSATPTTPDNSGPQIPGIDDSQPKVPAASTPKAESALKSAARQVASNIVPAAATAVGGLAGAAAGGMAGVEGGPLAIGTAIAGDLIGGIGGAALGRKAQDHLMGEKWSKENQAQLDANMAEHPIASKIGAFVPAVISMLGGGGGPTMSKAVGGYLERIAQSGATPTFIQKAIASLPENMIIGARMGSGAAAQNLAEGKGNANDLLTEAAKGAVTMGPVAFVPGASTLLGAALGKAPADAAVLATANALYDRATKGTPIDYEQLRNDIGTDIPGFVLFNLLSGLTHGHPMLAAKPPEGGPGEPTEPTKPSPLSEPTEPTEPSTPTTVTPQGSLGEGAEPPSSGGAIQPEPTPEKTTPSDETPAPATPAPAVAPAEAEKPPVAAGAPPESAVPPGMTNLGDVLDRARAETPKQPEVPLGMDRDSSRDRSLESLPEKQFDSNRLAINKELDAAEDHWDKNPDTQSHQDREKLAVLQDRYTTHDLEKYRRDTQDLSPEDLWQEMKKQVNVLPNDPKSARPGNDNLIRLHMLFEHMQKLGYSANDLARGMADSIGKLASNPDYREVLADDFSRAARYHQDFESKQPSVETAATPAQPASPTELKGTVPESAGTSNSTASVKKNADDLLMLTNGDHMAAIAKAIQYGKPEVAAELRRRTLVPGLEDQVENKQPEPNAPGKAAAEAAPAEPKVKPSPAELPPPKPPKKAPPAAPVEESKPRVKVGDQVGTFTVEEKLPSRGSFEGDEKYYRVKNERTGEEQTVERKDMKMVKGSTLSDEPAEPKDLRASIGREPSDAQYIKDLQSAAEKAPSERDLLAAGKSPTVIDFKRPNGVTVSVQNTQSAINELLTRAQPERVSGHYMEVANRIQEVKDNYKFGKIRVLNDERDLPPDLRAQVGDQKHEAIVDAKTGEVFLFAKNIESPDRAEQVLAHEIIGHLGVEKLLGEKDWSRVTDAIMADPSAQRELRSIAATYHGTADLAGLTDAQRLTVAREYMARMAENPQQNPTLWRSIVLAVKKALRAMGFRRNWSMDELQQVVRDAAKAVREEPHHSNFQKRAEDGSFNGPVRNTRASLWSDVQKKAADEWVAGKHEWNAMQTKGDVAAGHDAVTNIAKMAGEQIGNRMRLAVLDAEDRKAMPFVIESGGDPNKLQDMRAKIAAGDADNAKKYLPVVDHAISNAARLEPARQIHDQAMADSLAELKSHGVEVGEVANYVSRVLDAPDAIKDMLPNPLFSMGGGGGNSPRYFTKGRAFETLADAIAAGYKPKGTDFADLDQHRIEAGQRIIEQKKFLNEVKRTPAPQDGKPIIGELEQRNTIAYNQKLGDWVMGGRVGPPPKPEMSVPRGYTMVNVGGAPMPVHNQFSGLFRDLYGRSAVRDLTVGRALLKTAAAAKAGTLVFDTFHVGRVLFKMATGGGGLPLTMREGRPAFNIHEGRAALEYGDADLATAVAQKNITQQEADAARAMRPKLERLMRHGLNVGNVSDNLMQQAGLHLPILSDLNSWIFQKLSRSAMTQTAMTMLDRNLKSTRFAGDEVGAYRQTAREANDMFGNLQNQGIFKSKTLQDVARLIFLAPNWAESQARNEARAYGQTARSAVNAVRGKGLEVGNSARAFAAGFTALLAANQVINYLSRGQSTFQNQESNHQLDAWIPGGNRGFFYNPFSIVGEYASAALKYAQQKENAVDTATHILSNKLSPLARGTKEAISGRDYAGRPFDNDTDRFRSAATSALPSPIPLGAFLEKDPRQPLGYRANRQPASVEKQALQATGMKVTPVQSPISATYALAKPFREDKSGHDFGEYTALRRALDDSDESGARAEIKWLADRGKSRDEILRSAGIGKGGEITPQNFTGNADREKAFVRSLSASDRATYAAAQVSHRENAMMLKRLMPSNIPTRPVDRGLVGLPH